MAFQRQDVLVLATLLDPNYNNIVAPRRRHLPPVFRNSDGGNDLGVGLEPLFRGRTSGREASQASRVAVFTTSDRARPLHIYSTTMQLAGVVLEGHPWRPVAAAPWARAALVQRPRARRAPSYVLYGATARARARLPARARAQALASAPAPVRALAAFLARRSACFCR